MIFWSINNKSALAEESLMELEMMMTELFSWIFRTTGGMSIKEFNAAGSTCNACAWGLKNILANVRYLDLQFYP